MVSFSKTMVTSFGYAHIAPVTISVIPKSIKTPPTTPAVSVLLFILVVLRLYPEAKQLIIISSLSFDTFNILLELDIDPISPSPSLVTTHVVALGSMVNTMV